MHQAAREADRASANHCNFQWHYIAPLNIGLQRNNGTLLRANLPGYYKTNGGEKRIYFSCGRTDNSGDIESTPKAS
jgi:hypothetical protein